MPQRGGASRGEVVITDDRAKLVLTFFFRSPKSQWTIKRLVPGMVGMFAGTVSSFRGRLQLVHPEYELLPGAARQRRSDAGAGGRVRRRDDPGLPGQREGQLVGDRPVGQDRARAAGRGRGPDPGRGQGAARAGRAGRGHPGHPPAAGPGRRCDGPGTGSSGTRRSCSRSRWPQRRLAAAAMPAMPRPACRGRHARRIRRRLPFTLTAGQSARWARRSRPTWPAPTRCTGCSRARSARARPWSRCGPCSRWSTRAARPRCWRPPRCSPSSTTGRSPRCSARSPAARVAARRRPSTRPA